MEFAGPPPIVTARPEGRRWVIACIVCRPRPTNSVRWVIESIWPSPGLWAMSAAARPTRYSFHRPARSALQSFRQACSVVGTVISSNARFAVADVGLKALGMDHGLPAIEACTVWLCSDEHVTFAADGGAPQPSIGSRVHVAPAHIDPTIAMHEIAWIVRDDEVVDRWEIDLRGW